MFGSEMIFQKNVAVTMHACYKVCSVRPVNDVTFIFNLKSNDGDACNTFNWTDGTIIQKN